MIGSLRARILSVLVLGSLWLTAVAAPTAAANQTRWVDDDAGAGGGPAACATAGYTSIQAAIDASSSYDTVYVCPGTYPEQLTLDVTGITVQSRPSRAAHIVAPAAMTDVDGIVSLVRMEAWGARLIGFRLDIPAGDAPVPGVSTTNYCSPVDVVVLAVGERQRVKKNYIDSIGDHTYAGSCGYGYGIVFAELVSAAIFSPPYPSETSRASKNVVRDFKFGGILADGSVKVRIDYNRVRFVHADDPACAPPTNQIAPQVVCEPGSPTVSEVNSAFPNSFGIGAESGALVDIEGNTVYGNYDVLVDGMAGSFHVAIHLVDADGDSRVRGNTVRNFAGGIIVGGLIITASSLRPSVTATGPTTGAEIKNNTVTDTFVGIGVAADASHIHLNRSRLNILGMSILAGEDNIVHDNDFSFNLGRDCEDDTTGLGTAGTANWWTDNLGITSDPLGLCTGPIPN